VHDHDSAEGLVPVEEAQRKILSQVKPLAPLQLSLAEAYGCVLAEEIVATRDLPEFPS
jgi:molybdopterin biosynthesis enzyme